MNYGGIYKVLFAALLLLDSADTLGQHWPDLALATLLTFCLWLIQRWISGLEKRHERAEDEFKEMGQRIVRLETQVELVREIHLLSDGILQLVRVLESRDRYFPRHDGQGQD